MVKVIRLQTALIYTFHKSVILGLPQTERKILEARYFLCQNSDRIEIIQYYGCMCVCECVCIIIYIKQGLNCSSLACSQAMVPHW